MFNTVCVPRFREDHDYFDGFELSGCSKVAARHMTFFRVPNGFATNTKVRAWSIGIQKNRE